MRVSGVNSYDWTPSSTMNNIDQVKEALESIATRMKMPVADVIADAKRAGESANPTQSRVVNLVRRLEKLGGSI